MDEGEESDSVKQLDQQSRPAEMNDFNTGKYKVGYYILRATKIIEGAVNK